MTQVLPTDREVTRDRAIAMDRRFTSAMLRAHGGVGYEGRVVALARELLRVAKARTAKRETGAVEKLLSEVAGKHQLLVSDLSLRDTTPYYSAARDEAFYCLLQLGVPRDDVGRILDRNTGAVLAGARRHAQRAGSKG